MGSILLFFNLHECQTISRCISYPLHVYPPLSTFIIPCSMLLSIAINIILNFYGWMNGNNSTSKTMCSVINFSYKKKCFNSNLLIISIGVWCAYQIIIGHWLDQNTMHERVSVSLSILFTVVVVCVLCVSVYLVLCLKLPKNITYTICTSTTILNHLFDLVWLLQWCIVCQMVQCWQPLCRITFSFECIDENDDNFADRDNNKPNGKCNWTIFITSTIQRS